MRLYDAALSIIIIHLVVVGLATSHVMTVKDQEIEKVGEPCNYGRKTCVKIVIKGEKR